MGTVEWGSRGLVVAACAWLALAGCGSGNGRTDGGPGGGGGSVHCENLPSFGSCHCDDSRVYDGGPARCDLSTVGPQGICCQSGGVCDCKPISCGLRDDGVCVCGSLLPPFPGGRTSCTGTATTCCTTGNHYCYCQDGCEMQFGSRVVDSCDLFTDTVMCDTGDTQVSACE